MNRNDPGSEYYAEKRRKRLEDMFKTIMSDGLEHTFARSQFEDIEFDFFGATQKKSSAYQTSPIDDQVTYKSEWMASERDTRKVEIDILDLQVGDEIGLTGNIVTRCPVMGSDGQFVYYVAHKGPYAENGELAQYTSHSRITVIPKRVTIEGKFRLVDESQALVPYEKVRSK